MGLSNKEQWKSLFNQTASNLEDSTKRSSFASSANTITLHDTVRRLVGQPQGKRLLDAGCGDGSLLSCFTNNNDVVALDFSQEMLKHARNVGLLPISADMDFMPFKKASFDIITSVEAITLLDNPYQVIAEFIQLLRPGGRLVLSVLNDKYLARRLITPFYEVFGRMLPTPLKLDKVLRCADDNEATIDSIQGTLLLPGKSIVTCINPGDSKLLFANNIILDIRVN